MEVDSSGGKVDGINQLGIEIPTPRRTRHRQLNGFNVGQGVAGEEPSQLVIVLKNPKSRWVLSLEQHLKRHIRSQVARDNPFAVRRDVNGVITVVSIFWQMISATAFHVQGRIGGPPREICAVGMDGVEVAFDAGLLGADEEKKVASGIVRSHTVNNLPHSVGYEVDGVRVAESKEGEVEKVIVRQQVNVQIIRNKRHVIAALNPRAVHHRLIAHHQGIADEWRQVKVQSVQGIQVVEKHVERRLIAIGDFDQQRL